ncbi:probable carboxylesterase 12 [Lolium perenne]|uniref:probable carboxylesterase 12 n=1 Tax=Lolium perenne TaxID=4522 RepID=UPI0021EA9897|nr:probable carboxylesterase 12 [Lolium perenne]
MTVGHPYGHKQAYLLPYLLPVTIKPNGHDMSYARNELYAYIGLSAVTPTQYIVSMAMAIAIRSGATFCSVWAATQPWQRLVVDRRRRPLQQPYSFATISTQLRWMIHSTSHKNGAVQAAATEAELDDEVLLEAPAQFRIYKSGRMDRLNEPTLSPPGLDEATGVTSRDVVLDADTGVSVRLYLPKLPDHHSPTKLPVLVFFHGGAFLLGSADDAAYHNYVNALAAEAGVLAVSVDYRLAPEHPLPAAYDDSWAALRWAASAQDGWIAEHGDLSRLFLAGDSAGANIVHDMLLRAASNDNSPRVEGAILLHPWFSGTTAVEGEPPAASKVTGMLWSYACPGAVGGADDPRMNPLAPGAPALEKLGCVRMLVTAGLADGLAARNRAYHDAVAGSGWRGTAAWLGSEGEGHVFFLGKPGCENAKQLMDRVVAFIAGA